MARYVLVGQNERHTVEADGFRRTHDLVEFHKQDPVTRENTIIASVYCHCVQGVYLEECLLENR